jgi:hypothetical protein
MRPGNRYEKPSLPDVVGIEGVRVLGDVIAERLFLRAKCRNPDCRDNSRLVVADLVKRLGYDFLVSDLRKRLRCSGCRRKEVSVVVMRPERG